MPSLISNAANRVVRVAATAAHALLKAVWFVRRPRTFGAHAIALTPEKRLILVRLRYARGWRLPGGGRSEDEGRCKAALRELREEIGMIAHGDAQLAGELETRTDFKHDASSLVIVRDVAYRPRKWNLEVEEVGDFALDSLPADVSPLTARWIRAIAPSL